jgi:hypothetical protein
MRFYGRPACTIILFQRCHLLYFFFFFFVEVNLLTLNLVGSDEKKLLYLKKGLKKKKLDSMCSWEQANGVFEY